MAANRFLLPVVDDRFDKYVFIGAFLAGAAAIAFLRLILHQELLYALVPAAVLLAYFAYVLVTARHALSLDRAGDNIYYLGLLFTLMSLSLSLLNVARFGQAALALNLISGFGVALFSTIAGMFLRILVQQLRSDTSDVDRITRIELGEAGKALRGELYSVITDLNSYRRAITQSLKEVGDETLKAIQSTSKESSDAIKAAATGLAAVATHLQSVETVVSRFVSAEANVTATATRIEGISNGAHVSVEALHRAAERHLEALRGLAREDVASGLDHAVKQLQLAAERAANLTSNLEATAAALSSAAKAADEDQQKVAILNSRLSEAEAMVVRVQQSLSGAVLQLRDEVRRAS